MRGASAAAATTTVALVDDHEIVLRGLRSILELEADIRVVGQAGDRETALSLVEEQRPDVIILDLKLDSHDAAATSGLELCTDVLAIHPAGRVVIFTAFANYGLVLDAIRRGASGYVLKDVDSVDLLRIIRAVRDGTPGFDTEAVRLLVGSVGTAGQHNGPILTSRQREVSALVAQGKTNTEIGHALFLSESTVKYHLRAITQKLGARHRAEIAYLAASLGLL